MNAGSNPASPMAVEAWSVLIMRANISVQAIVDSEKFATMIPMKPSWKAVAESDASAITVRSETSDK